MQLGQPQMGNIPQGPDMSVVSQMLQQMRGKQPQQQQGMGGGLMGLMPLLMQMMGGQGGQFTPQATGIAQQNLGLANQSPLSLMNPNYGFGK